MKALLLTLAGGVGVPLIFVVAMFAAYASPSSAATAINGRAPGLARPFALQSCARLRASDIAWVTLDDNYDIDEQVEFYPSGTELITPVFEYDCVPSGTSVTTIYSLDGDVVFSDKETVRATTRSGLYAYPLGTTDGSALPDGLWGVEYFNGQTLLTSGEVRVGDAASTSIAVEGTVKDKKTKRNIRGATVLVLVPGVTAQAWVSGGQDGDDVFTAGQSTSQGTFTLNDPLTRNETYSLIVVARGYKPIATDSFVIDDEVEAPAQLDIVMSK